MSSNKYKKIGSIRQSKEGGYYLKLDDKIEVTVDGEKINGTLSLDTPEDKLKFLLEKGYIDENTYGERLAKVPEYVKFEVTASSKKN